MIDTIKPLTFEREADTLQRIDSFAQLCWKKSDDFGHGLVQVQDAQLQPAEEKYLVPLLHPGGAGNQLVEYKSAATIARALNRTLCLIPFFEGPNGHLGEIVGPFNPQSSLPRIPLVPTPKLKFGLFGPTGFSGL